VFVYLEITPTNKNPMHEEIKSRLKSEMFASFGVEYFVFKFAIQKYKYQDIHKYNLAFFCMGMKLGLSH
jgi:hypothetical protein